MNPKKSTDFYNTVADDTGASKKLVEQVVEFYWKRVKKALVTCENSGIKLHGLGMFRAKPWKLPEIMRKYEAIRNKYQSIIDSGQKISFQKFAIMKEAEERLEQLRSLELMLDADNIKKQLVKEKRNAAKIKDNLEEPQRNIPGIKE